MRSGSLRSTLTAVPLALVALCACDALSIGTSGNPPPPAASGDDSGTPATQDFSCDALPDPHCYNPINRILVPRLRAANIPLRDAQADEFCRRAYVDLLGRVPKPAELDACRAMKPDAAVDALMHAPEYAMTMARAWGEVFDYDLYFRAYYLDTLDLDAVVRSAYAPDSPLPYADFAAKAVLHPAFYSVRPGDDWPKYIWTIFLGRTARLDEVESFRPLESIWGSRGTCDGTLWWQALQDGGQANADAFCTGNGYPTTEWAADFCQCQPGYASPFGCKSDALGRSIDFGTEGCKLPSDPTNEGNLVALTDHPQGAHKTCPDGSTRPECLDRELVYDQTTGDTKAGGPLPALPVPSGPQVARLRQLGDALAARPDFWEAAANREIKRFLGWWQNGVRRPDFDVPEVRSLLADQLRKGGSLPAIQKVLLTSLLYDAPADAPDGVADPPLWSMGPSKFLGSEMWLDAAGIATLDQPAGVCDYRFLSGGYTGVYDAYVDRKLIAYVTAPLAPQGLDAYTYYAYAQKLGGCNADAPRPRESSVGVTYTQHDLAQALCAYGGAVLPPGFDAGDTSDGALGNAAKWMVRRAWSRDATPEDVAGLVADMKQCLAAGATDGCAGAEAAARWNCARIVDSAPFALY